MRRVRRVVSTASWLRFVVFLAGVVWVGATGAATQEGRGSSGKSVAGPSQVGQGEVQREAVLLRKSIGSGQEQLGCEAEEEAVALGPMSFAVDDDETLYVLDQVNARIQVYRNNTWVRSLSLASVGAVDVDICPWGQVVVLDNLVENALFVLDASSGAVMHRIPLEGKNIAYAPAVTSVYCRANGPYSGIWVEVDRRSVRLGTDRGLPDRHRVSLPGTLDARGETLVRAELIGDVTVMLYRSTERFSQWHEYPVSFPTRVGHLTVVSVDQAGNAYLGAFLEDGETSQNLVVKLDAKGKEVTRFVLPVQQRPEEVHCPVKVSPEGRVYHMMVEESEVVVRSYGP